MKTDLNLDICRCLNAIAGRKITHIFLVACGGSLSIMQAGKYFLDTHLSMLSSDIYNSAEFVARNPCCLGANALVILCSQTGTTKETVKAAAYAQSKGALTIAMTMEEVSPLTEVAGHVVIYQAPYTTAISINAADSNYGVLYMLLAGIVRLIEKKNMIPALLDSLNVLQEVIERAQRQYDERFECYGERYRHASVIYTLGSGVNYGAAYSFAICVLMEMLWINSQAIHANEFFHGPFEVVDDKTNFIVLLGLDETRPLESRARDFLYRFGTRENILILDAAEMDLTGMDQSFKAYLMPLIFFDILWKFAYKLAQKRNKIMLDGRRYMKKITDY